MARLFTGPERRTFSRRLARALADERLRLWSAYYQVCDPDPTAERCDRALRVFREELLIYLCFGQFNIYKPYADGYERRASVISTSCDLYRQITDSTYRCLHFCETWQERDCCPRTLAPQLATLGEVLLKRARQEDQIVKALSN